MNQLRIVYMGTPEFAVAGLRSLVESGYEVVAVVTMPDKPAGRGHKIQFSPVKEYALSQGLPVLQPERLKDETFLSTLRSYQADLQIVTAFRMLPEVVWSMPRLGTFNVHASLLPQYRGAAPINRAIMNGETRTGLTTFMLRHEIDTGNIILQESTPIGEEEDAGTLHDRLMAMSQTMLLRTMQLINDYTAKGLTIPTTPQPEDVPLTPAPKIFKEDCEIRLGDTAEQIRNHVRGLSPYPGAWCDMEIAGKRYENVKVYKVRKYAGNDTSGKILMACQDGKIEVLELQLPGKKRMDAKSLLNGIRTD